jgi:hypothetical protein
MSAIGYLAVFFPADKVEKLVKMSAMLCGRGSDRHISAGQ